MESKLPAPELIEKEKEQKFKILYSLAQATIDFNSYSSEIDSKGSIGVLYLDIDKFKLLNERYTETVVDQYLLAPFQQLLSDACLYRGGAYRHGGEEFLVLLPNQTAEEVEQFAERLRKQIETKEFSVGEDLVTFKVSIGISLWPKHGEKLDALIANANSAEHLAKRKGRNRIEVYNEGTI